MHNFPIPPPPHFGLFSGAEMTEHFILFMSIDKRGTLGVIHIHTILKSDTSVK
jgi:hypothetical protein